MKQIVTYPLSSHVPSRDALRRRVVAEVRSVGTMARVELADAMGVSRATITETVAGLIEDGVLIELGDEAGIARAGRGRPRVRLGFRGDRHGVVGVWIGQDRVEMTLVDAAGVRRAERVRELPLSALDGDALIAALETEIGAFRRSIGRGPRLAGLGIACQGYIDNEAGTIAWSPVLSCRDVPVAPALSGRLGVPVLIDNDAAALALALGRREPRLLKGRTACIMMGDGVGLGLLIEGKLYRGARSGGSEFGHIRLDRRGPQCRCGARGCIEAYIADYAVWRDAGLIRGTGTVSLQPSESDLVALGDAARRGGAAAHADLFEMAGRTLADGVGIIIQLLEPDHVVICGPGARWHDLIAPAFEARLSSAAIPELRALADIRFSAYDPRLRTEGMVARVLERLDEDLDL